MSVFTQWRQALVGFSTTAALVALVGVGGCTVDTEFVQQEDLFTCQTDADCINPPYKCDTNVNLCRRIKIVEILCIDEDQDGYGSNEDGQRDKCAEAEQDLDDADDTVYPGAPELCDGKDNNGTDGVDEPRSCTSISDCNRDEPAPQGTIFFCESSVCVLKPANQVSELCMMPLACTGGAYAALPEECK